MNLLLLWHINQMLCRVETSEKHTNLLAALRGGGKVMQNKISKGEEKNKGKTIKRTFF